MIGWVGLGWMAGGTGVPREAGAGMVRVVPPCMPLAGLGCVRLDWVDWAGLGATNQRISTNI